MRDELTQRAAVLAEARTWLGTPFEDCACVKGHGVDCAHFIAAVFETAGVVGDQQVEAYSPQWLLHKDEERFLAYVQRSAVEIDESQLKPADVVMYRFGRVFAHGAIVVEWPTKIIHAYKMSGRVLITGHEDSALKGRPRRAFSCWAKA